MNIIGNGVDIVDNARIKNAIKNKFFVSRIFTVNEIKKSKNLNNKANYFAKRFAAKEAFVKALGGSEIILILVILILLMIKKVNYHKYFN